MARKRNKKQRQDYRQGGRVQLRTGGAGRGGTIQGGRGKGQPKTSKVTVAEEDARNRAEDKIMSGNQTNPLTVDFKKDPAIPQGKDRPRTSSISQPLPSVPTPMPKGTSTFTGKVPAPSYEQEMGYVDMPKPAPREVSYNPKETVHIAPVVNRADPSTVQGSFNIKYDPKDIVDLPEPVQKAIVTQQQENLSKVAPNKVTNEMIVKAAVNAQKNAMDSWADAASKGQASAVLGNPRGDAWRSGAEDGGDSVDRNYGVGVTVEDTVKTTKAWQNEQRMREGKVTDVDGNPLPLGAHDWNKADLAMRKAVGGNPTTEQVLAHMAINKPEQFAASNLPISSELASNISATEANSPFSGFPENPENGDTHIVTLPTGDQLTFIWNGSDWELDYEDPDEDTSDTDDGTDDGTGDDNDGGSDDGTGDDGDGTGTDDGTGTTTPVQTESIEDVEAYTRQLAAGEGPQGQAVISEGIRAGYKKDADGNLLRDEDGNLVPLDDMQATDFEVEGVRTYSDIADREAVVEEYLKDAEGNFVTDAEGNLIPDTKETVTIGAVDQADGPETDLEASTFYATQVAPDVNIITPEGTVSEEAVAEMQTQALTQQAEGVVFSDEQQTRGLTDEVTGTLSAEAMANAARVAGTDLPRVFRAKRLLRRAGLTEDQIFMLGNDPEALEEVLMDYTEEERGMIAGLPTEALVSNQLSSLLEGIDSGEIPAFARPAVNAINQMLAMRGLSVSTVGRDALVDTLIKTAMPLAQQNAETVKESVLQQRTIEAQAEQVNAQMRQQTALSNADKVFNMDMAKFTSDQQIALSNSKFLQSTSLSEVDNEARAVMQNAASMANLDIATLDSNTKLAAQNAQAFLNMDMTNITNRQQSNILKAQQEQQRILSNQSADNAAKQINAQSENQTNQFMASLHANIEQFNATQANAMTQFNATAKNQAEAREFASEIDLSKFNAQLATQIDQYNAQQDFAATQWEAQNAAMIEAANVEYYRKRNTANTAIQNQINMQNAMNAYNMSTQSIAFLSQRLRDQADFDWRAFENQQNREAQIITTAIANEGEAGKTYDDFLSSLVQSLGTAYNINVSANAGTVGGGPNRS